MINGVLVEKTVKEVTPALQTNSEGLKKVLEELVKQYKRQQEDMEKWKVSPSDLASSPGKRGAYNFCLELSTVGKC